MPDLTLSLILISLGALALGVLIGWLIRAHRAEVQKAALHAEWQDQLDSARRAERRTNRQRKDLRAELAQARNELQQLTAATIVPNLGQSAGGDTAELQHALAECKERRDSLREQLERFIDKSREMAEASREKDEKIFALSRELESWQQRLPPLVDRYREKDEQAATVRDELEAAQQRTAELEETLRTRVMPGVWHDFGNEERGAGFAANGDLPPPHAEPAPDSSPRDDDLRRIRGIGPKLERILNDLGIYRIAQIAELDDDGVARLASRLPRFPDRIVRDAWVQQARDLCKR